MTVGRLIAPEGDDEILDLDPEALGLKPLMTGDIFVGVNVPGEPAPVDVMVAGHPCTIRRGSVIVDRVPCVRLIQHQWIRYDRWPDYDKNHFPIPSVAGLGPQLCASLWEWVAVPKEELLRSRRRVTLQDHGIYVFLQRLIHSLSRFAPPLTALKSASAHVLAEAEIEYTWVMELFDGRDYDDPSLAILIEEFGIFMGANGRRDSIADDRRRVAAEVNEEIQRRQNDGAATG